MKKFLVALISLAAGAAIGVGISMLASYSDSTSSNANIGTTIINIIVAVLMIGVAAYMQIILHEAGHLVCGLINGYRFVSFRIGSLTIIKQNEKLRIKRFNIAGTGGQCLLAPPKDAPLDEVPTMLYNAGGVLSNIITATIALILLLNYKTIMPMWLIYLLCGNVVFGYVFALLNGIPLKLGGIGNDGYNMLNLNKNKQSVKAFSMILIANEMNQNGTRPKDIPSEYIELGENIDYGDSLQCNLEIMRISKVLDSGDTASAYEQFKQLIDCHQHEMLPMLTMEAKTELAFTALATGDKELAQNILSDKKLNSYIKVHSKVMTSKQRLLMAKALFLDNDREKAEDIYKNVVNKKNKYLMQGEVESDIELMKQCMQIKPLTKVNYTT